MADKSYKSTLFKRAIDLGKITVGIDTDLVKVWRTSTGEEKAISLGDIAGGLVGDYVPYTGAVDDVDLGEYGLSTGYIKFDTTPTNTPLLQGTLAWAENRSTLGLIMNGTLQYVGQNLFLYVKNSTGSTISKGANVGFAGTDGASGHVLISKFLANGSSPSTYYIGVTSEDIANGAFGQVMVFGELSGINTSGYPAGSLLYASTTVAGEFQTTVPQAPNNIILVCATINSKNNGDIIVRPTIGSNINNDEGVKITSGATGDLLQLQASGLWENKTKAQILGGTSSQFVKGDGSLDSTTYQSTAQKGQPSGYASLDSNGKVPLTQINDALLGNVNYQGLWNASTNNPTLANPPSAGTKGYYYIVSTAGTFASISFEIGDWIISNGSSWSKVDNTDAVSSVFGRTGNVTAAEADYQSFYPRLSQTYNNPSWINQLAWSKITGTPTTLSGYGITDAVPNLRTITINGTTFDLSANRSWTIPTHDAVTIGTANGLSLSGQIISLGLASNLVNGALSSTDWTTFNNKQNAISLTTTGSSGASTLIGSTLNIPNYTLAGLGGVPTSRTITINGTTLDLSANRSWSVGTVTSVGLSSATSGVTIGSTPVTGSGTITLTIATASGSQQGLLSSTDWTTFNNKQNALTNPVTGTGTQNYLSKFTSTGSAIGNSQIFDNGTNVGIGTNTPANPLTILKSANSLLTDGIRVDRDPSTNSYMVLNFFGGTANIISKGQDSNFGIIRLVSSDGTSSEERLRIFSGGNVHIGLTPASDNGARLQVSGDVRIQPVGVDTNPLVIRSSVINNNLFVINQDLSGNGSLFLLTSSGSNAVQLRASGDTSFSGGTVTVGSTPSGDKLRVEGITYTNKIITELPNTTTRGVEWKLGEARIDTIPNANRLIRVEIDGVQYDILCREVI